MKQILKVNNSELSFRLKLNYNNVYSRLKMLLGASANIFADVLTKSAATTWYSGDDAEYTAFPDAPKSEGRAILVALNSKLKAIKKELSASPELAPFADDILEVPDDNYIFYRRTPAGYEFVLAGWGCKLAHTGVSDTGGIIKRISKTIGQDEEYERAENKPDINDGGGEDANDGDNGSIADDLGRTGGDKPHGKPDVKKELQPDSVSVTDNSNGKPDDKKDDVAPKRKKEQHVIIRVINQNKKRVEDESVKARTDNGILEGYTDENGEYDLGDLPYHSTFGIQFPEMPAIQERTFEVEPKVEHYEVYIKKYVNYSPVLFVEDQNGNVVDNYNVKVIIAGQDITLNTGNNGMIQLPTMQEGQKFIVIDSTNYANSQEYSVTPENVKAPYLFTIKRIVKSRVGITVLDKDENPLEGVTVDVNAGSTPCQQATDSDGRAEFPYDVFAPGEVDLTLYTKGKGTIKSKSNYSPDTTEYTIQLQGKKPRPELNWKWLMMLPLLLLLCGVVFWLYNKFGQKYPTVKEMETGVAMIYGEGVYYANLGVRDIEINGFSPVAYIQFDQNGDVCGFTFNPNEPDTPAKTKILQWTGTGFLISKDGLIATNRHVAAPETPQGLSNALKRVMHGVKDHYQEAADQLNNELQVLGGSGALHNAEMREVYKTKLEALQYAQQQVRIFDNLLQNGDFSIRNKINLYAAFTGTIVEGTDNMIPLSKPRAIGEPGGIDENDVAITQITKKNEIPTDAFIFTVPEVDIMDGDIEDGYEITVLGYNAGLSPQSLEYQNGIEPQAQHGKISSRSKKYLIEYDASIIGGSSGSPVVNNKGELVAINNSGIQGASMSRGVRTKYLKELLDNITNKNKNKKQDK